jgi:PAS domain S-box-containing protein
MTRDVSGQAAEVPGRTNPAVGVDRETSVTQGTQAPPEAQGGGSGDNETSAHGAEAPQPDLSYAQFRALANSIPNLAWMADADGWLIWYNRRWYDYTGTTPEQMAGWGWQSVHHPDVLPEMLRRWTHALKVGEPFEWTFPLRRGSDGSYRMFMTRAEPLKDNGRIVGWLGTNTDITDLERTKERLQLVINELNHRVKNTLATVQSIAKNTFGKANPELYKIFEQRLFALSGVHEALTNNAWSGSSLRELIQRALSIFSPDRFVLSSPDISVPSRIASALAMTLHELCTNAVKYGSLSGREGRVHIQWEVETIGTRRWLSLSWKEVGGPPTQKPERTGYGLRLITRAAAVEPGATVDHQFAPDGVSCEIRLPIDEGLVR